MPRSLVVLLAVLCPCALAASAQAADEIELGSLAVNGRAESTATSTLQLKGGVTYRMVVMGTVTSSVETNSASYDALYCFQSTSTQCAQPFPESGALGLGLKATSSDPSTTGLEKFSDEHTYQPYNGGHSYSFHVTPGVNSYLFLKAWPAYFADDGVTRTGSFTVTIYGPAEAGCPENNARQTDTNDLGTCDYDTSWSVTLDHKPTGGPQDVTRVVSKGRGHIQFDRRPKLNVTALGDTSGILKFQTRFRAFPQINDGNPSFVTYTFRLFDGRVHYSHKARTLYFDAEISHITGRGPRSCQERNQGTIKLVHKAGPADDVMTLHFRNGPTPCLDFDGSGESLHVRIDRPVKI